MAKRKSSTVNSQRLIVNGTGVIEPAVIGADVIGAAAALLPIYPDISFEDYEYAKLQLRLDLYPDFILATRYADGREVESSFMVDPFDLAERMGALDTASGLLPENCLFWQRKNGQERIGVWLPPKAWELRVETTGQPNRLVPLPGMVFAGQGLDYRLYALAGAERPTVETLLYKAPVSNLSSNVCTGNVEFPTAGAATIYRAVGAFFESEFNTHLDDGKSRKYPNSILRMWRVLHRKKATVYPVEDLVAAESNGKQLRLGDIL